MDRIRGPSVHTHTRTVSRNFARARVSDCVWDLPWSQRAGLNDQGEGWTLTFGWLDEMKMTFFYIGDRLRGAGDFGRR